MKRTLSYLMVLTLMLFSVPRSFAQEKADTTAAAAPSKKNFKVSTALEKGEKSIGFSLLYSNFDSKNSEFLLLATNLSTSGSIFRIRPYFQYAYRDNCSVGFRMRYTNAKIDLSNANLKLFTDDLSFSLKDTKGTLNAFGASVFHRNYFGLDRKGTVSLFCEFELGYSFNKIDFGAGQYNTGNKVDLVFSPGVLLYILPFVSVEASIGLADLTYFNSRSYVDNVPGGDINRFGAGVHFNVMNLNFGISYHF